MTVAGLRINGLSDFPRRHNSSGYLVAVKHRLAITRSVTIGRQAAAHPITASNRWRRSVADGSKRILADWYSRVLGPTSTIRIVATLNLRSALSLIACWTETSPPPSDGRPDFIWSGGDRGGGSRRDGHPVRSSLANGRLDVSHVPQSWRSFRRSVGIHARRGYRVTSAATTIQKSRTGFPVRLSFEQ